MSSPAGSRVWVACPLAGAVLAVLAGLGLLARAGRTPAGVPPDLARTVLELRTREPVYHRTVGRLSERWAPALAARFPRVLGVRSVAALRRLEACHRLVALGPAAMPALRMLVQAFCDGDHDVRAYAFISLVHVQAPAARVAALIKESSGDPEVQAIHCARLLADEDDLTRDYAWALLGWLGANGEATAAVLETMASQTYDARLAQRAAALLSRGVRPDTGVPPVVGLAEKPRLSD